MNKELPKLRAKKCKNKGCGVMFIPSRPLQSVCSLQCAAVHAKTLRERKDKAEARIVQLERKAAKEKQKTARDYEKEIDKLHQEYSRRRDADLPCISCGKYCSPNGNESDGGHYISRKNKALRWREENCNKQCKYCNQFLKGNYPEYRKGMIAKYGLEKVEELENSKEPAPKYSIEELKQIKAEYRAKLKELGK